MIDLRGCGVLDAPLSRGMTSYCVSTGRMSTDVAELLQRWYACRDTVTGLNRLDIWLEQIIGLNN
jgi:hypothetical protein